CSPRANRPFVALNCGAIAESLLMSELFGHERGAFSGADRKRSGLLEAAGDGTIFLDEIGEISAPLQVALLRVLESGEYRPVGGNEVKTTACRVVAATNADLDALVEAGTFRRDLMFRLRRLEVRIPPLRERPSDIPPLARHFLSDGRADDADIALGADLVEALMRHDWPGNVRELRNTLERMRLLNSDKTSYNAADLNGAMRGLSGPGEPAAPPPAAPATPPAASAEPGDAPEPAASPPSRLPALASSRSPLRRRQRLRALFQTHGVLTRAEVIELLDISPNTATRDLQTLCDEDWIEKVCPTASSRSHYFQLKTESCTKE
ncbi:MAG: sigma 54-interacting transcriptional regulator, partial [Planctomycetota bacterium]